MDRYDQAVEYLTAHMDEVEGAWSKPRIHPHGCLFRIAAPETANDGVLLGSPDGGLCGCLTQVRGSRTGQPCAWVAVAWTDSLTERIRADARIPDHLCDITAASLPVFAEWQRVLDAELGREALPLLPVVG